MTKLIRTLSFACKAILTLGVLVSIIATSGAAILELMAR